MRQKKVWMVTNAEGLVGSLRRVYVVVVVKEQKINSFSVKTLWAVSQLGLKNETNAPHPKKKILWYSPVIHGRVECTTTTRTHTHFAAYLEVEVQWL